MLLVLFRHGIAAPHEDPDYPRDEDRPLTPKGIRRTEAAARGLRYLGVDPEVIFTSSLVRAVQTAEIAAKALGTRASALQETALLRPDAHPEELLEFLEEQSLEEALLVGHNPNLNRVLATSLELRDASPFELKKAGAACVDRGPEGPRLRWVLGPSALRRLRP